MSIALGLGLGLPFLQNAAGGGDSTFSRLWEDSTGRYQEDGVLRYLENAATMFVPAAGWDGTEGSGLVAAGVVATPTQDLNIARVNGKPILNILSMDRCAITGTLDVYFEVYASSQFGGYTIQACWEGPLQTVTDIPIARTYSNPPSTGPLTVYSHKITLDGTAARTLHASGKTRGWIVVTPTIGATYQVAAAKFIHYPRTALNRLTATAGAQAAGAQFDYILDVDQTITSSAGDTTDVRYGTLGRALGRANGYGADVLVGLRITNLNGAAGVRFDNGATNSAGTGVTAAKREAWAFVFPGTGISAPLIGDGVNFVTASSDTVGSKSNGKTNFDALMFDGMACDLRQYSKTTQGFLLPVSTNALIGFNACEIYHGTNTFGDPDCTGQGATTCYKGIPPQSYWIGSADVVGTKVYAHFYDNYLHDVAASAFVGTYGIIRGNRINLAGGTVFKNCAGAVHGNVVVKNGGIWSGLRSYYDAIQLSKTGAGAANAAFWVQGQSGNTRILGLTQTTATAWSPGPVNGTSSRMAIPSSGGALEGVYLYIPNPSTTTNIKAIAGDSTVVATTGTGTTLPSGSGSALGGGFLLIGTSFQGSVTANLLSVPSTTAALTVGQVLTGSGVTASCTITSTGTTVGGTTTYTVSGTADVATRLLNSAFTHVAMITSGTTINGVTVLKSVYDSAATGGVATPVPMTTISANIRAWAAANDSTWGAVDQTPAAGAPVMAAQAMGANLSTGSNPSGVAALTPPTPINSSPPAGVAGMVYTWWDQHADFFFLDSSPVGTPWQNITYCYNDFSQARGANVIQLNGTSVSPSTTYEIAVIGNTWCEDDALIYGQGFSGGVLGSTGGHVLIKNNTTAGGVITFNTQWTPDSLCEVDGNAFYSMNWQFRASYPTLRIVNTVFTSGNSIVAQGADGTCSLTAITDPNLYTFIPQTVPQESTAPNFVPLQGAGVSPLTLSDGVTAAGAYNFNGTRKVLAA